MYVTTLLPDRRSRSRARRLPLTPPSLYPRALSPHAISSPSPLRLLSIFLSPSPLYLLRSSPHSISRLPVRFGRRAVSRARGDARRLPLAHRFEEAPPMYVTTLLPDRRSRSRARRLPLTPPSLYPRALSPHAISSPSPLRLLSIFLSPSPLYLLRSSPHSISRLPVRFGRRAVSRARGDARRLPLAPPSLYLRTPSPLHLPSVSSPSIFLRLLALSSPLLSISHLLVRFGRRAVRRARGDARRLPLAPPSLHLSALYRSMFHPRTPSLNVYRARKP